MSDFLTNLAARALHAAPVVQPRLAARFEPPSAGDRFYQDDSFGGEAETFLESAAPPAPAAIVTHFERHMRARANRSELDTSPSKSLPPHEQPVANESPRAASPRETHAETTSPIVVKTVIEHPPPVAEKVNDRRSIRDARGVETLPGALPPLRPEPAPHIAANTTTSGPIVALPRLVPAPTPLQKPDRHEPAPTIRVTIGRVEVRAIVPPAPSPPRATPARANSLLSLDEYLKQRTEGRK